MANLPNKIKSGDTFRSSVVNTINNIIDYLSSQRIKGDGKTLKINQYANGITLSAIVNNDKSQKASGNTTIVNESPICAVVQNGSDLTGYLVELYSNGYDQPQTGYATAFLLQGNAQMQTIPTGTKLMVYPYNGMIDTLG